MKTINVTTISKYFNSNDLVKLINEKGIENTKFLVPMVKMNDFGFVKTRTSSDDKDIVVCTIVENRYKVNEKYKITLVAENEELYGSDDYYTMDLAHLIRDGYIKIIS